ncbi:hypothetical protein AX16_008221 [Volvariella volvacea WC 439]|nr:hypothetical protein AX16_008221 [Volvariella volvacea WC 439]
MISTLQRPLLRSLLPPCLNPGPSRPILHHTRLLSASAPARIGGQEPLGLPAKGGYGWPNFQFEEALGPDERYVVKRKLTWGDESSIWLARDLKEDKYVAIKALNGHNTLGETMGHLLEADALRRVSEQPSPFCPQLLDEFLISNHGHSGDHLCFVVPVLSGDLRTLALSHWNGRIPFPLVKRMIFHLLRGLAHLHKCGYAHTDVTPDHIFLDTALSTRDIDRLLVDDPSRRHPPDDSPVGPVSAAMSQPLPYVSCEEAMKRNFIVGDLGRVELSSKHRNKVVTPIGLRAPEVFLDGPRSEKIDIWSIGCSTFEYANSTKDGISFLSFTPDEELEMDETEHMLYQMILFSEEEFTAEQLNASSNASQYFDEYCHLKQHPKRFTGLVEAYIRGYGILKSEEDIVDTARFIKRCIRLNPEDRPSAEELLQDPWFDGVEQ